MHTRWCFSFLAVLVCPENYSLDTRSAQLSVAEPEILATLGQAENALEEEDEKTPVEVSKQEQLL